MRWISSMYFLPLDYFGNGLFTLGSDTSEFAARRWKDAAIAIKSIVSGAGKCSPQSWFQSVYSEIR
jgi:hypothetical protein